MIGAEGFLMAVVWFILPFLILSVFLWLFPPWKKHAEVEFVDDGISTGI
jgi:hypothetical protein